MNFLKTYSVLLILFLYLGGATSAYYYLGEGNSMIFLMGIFFLTFSFFKVIHLSSFVRSFAQYDIFAKIFPGYGWIYPFIEIGLGLCFVSQQCLLISSIITIVILLSTNIGVIMVLRKGLPVECACLGVVFKLPLSKITIIENTLMIGMAILYLWKIL